MTLATNGGSVSGTGEFNGEAAPGGPLTVVGTVSGTDVSLDLTFFTEFTDHTDTSQAHFDGARVLGQLRGTFTYFRSDTTVTQAVFIRP